jgi:hypothetical protein
MAYFEPLFSLAVEHAFHGGLGQDIEIVPDEACRRLMRLASLTPRVVQGRFEAWGSPEHLAALATILAGEGGAARLTFKIYSADPHFAQYTLPPVAPGRVLVLGSRQARVGTDGLSLLETARWQGGKSTRSLATPAIARLMAAQRSPRVPAAVLRLTITAAACVRTAEPALRHLVMRFEAARARWKYYLLGIGAGKAARITDLDREVTFRPLERARFGGQGEASVFLSDQAIPLRAWPTQRFQLSETASFGEKILIKRMPHARVGLCQRLIVDGQTELVSEIFINH